MSQITITDEAILAQLDSGEGTLEVLDGTGKLRAVHSVVRPGDLEPSIDEEELRRREQDTTCKLHTTEEVLARLRSI